MRRQKANFRFVCAHTPRASCRGEIERKRGDKPRARVRFVYILQRDYIVCRVRRCWLFFYFFFFEVDGIFGKGWRFDCWYRGFIVTVRWESDWFILLLDMVRFFFVLGVGIGTSGTEIGWIHWLAWTTMKQKYCGNFCWAVVLECLNEMDTGWILKSMLMLYRPKNYSLILGFSLLIDLIINESTVPQREPRYCSEFLQSAMLTKMRGSNLRILNNLLLKNNRNYSICILIKPYIITHCGNAKRGDLMNP